MKEDARSYASKGNFPPQQTRKEDFDMKKFLTMLMALAMMLSLVACGGNDAPAEDTTNDDAAQEEVQASTGSGAELTFTTGGSSGTY